MGAEKVAAGPPGSGTYRFVRRLLRLWFTLCFPKIRLLGAEAPPASGPLVFVVNHPASFLDALILVVTFEHEIDCLVRVDLLRGFVRGFIARGLGMIAYEEEGTVEQSALDACRERLARGRAVVTFAQPEARKAAEPPVFALRAATLALGAESLHSGEPGLRLFPVHLFLPVAPSQSTELLIYVEAPLLASDYLGRGDEQLTRRARVFAEALDRVCRQNAFRIQPPEFTRLLSDVEGVLRADLEADWASRPNWKQTTQDFKLSRFVEDSAEQLNALHPGRLVALRESLDRYRAIERGTALRQLEVGLAGSWLKSPLRWLGAWVESVLGFPVACYGLVNHIPIGLILLATGLVKRSSKRPATSVWATRLLVVGGCYALEVAFSAHHFGRAAAGYYAASLPFSGAYVWRYAWLLRHRTRLLFFAACLRGQTRKLGRLRKRFIEELNEVRDTYARVPGVARTS